MSNFTCEVCGAPILEDATGHYISECPHYPMEKLKRLAIKRHGLLKVVNYSIEEGGGHD